MKYLIYIATIVLYARSGAIRRVLGQISLTQRVFLLLMVGLIVAGQLYEKKYPTYPFVKWGMYAKIDHKGAVYAFSGVRPDGTEFRLPMTRLVRTHSKRFVWRLRSLAQEIGTAESDEERARLEDLYDRSLRAAWGLYHERHPEIEIVAIRVHRLNVNVRHYERKGRIPRELYREVPL